MKVIIDFLCNLGIFGIGFIIGIGAALGLICSILIDRDDADDGDYEAYREFSKVPGFYIGCELYNRIENK